MIQLKHETWARAYGVNYVYLAWALVYETVWVTMLPVLLAERIFPDRRHESWLSRAGAIILLTLFLLGSFLAWFSWTQIARVQVFHLPLYTPPAPAMIVSLLAIAAAIGTGLRPPRSGPVGRAPPAPWLVGLLAAVWAILW